jgi:renalase
MVLTQRIAVIGAGLAGLSCARVLRRAGCYVEVFEQERTIGGRMGSTRLGGVAFDHGCQNVAAKGSRFRSFIEEATANGYAARWNAKASQGEEGGGQLQPWFVGTPGMPSIMRPLAESVRINSGRKVHTLQRVDKSWHLWFEDQTSAGPFAAVAVCVPAPEARVLLGPLPKLVDAIQKVRMSPCWALLVRIEDRILPDQDVFSDMSQLVRWVARNNSKPGRTGRGDHIVIHASPAWSRETEDAEPELVAEELWGEVSHVLSLPPIRPAQMIAHLWRNGIVETSLGETYLYSRDDRVGLAGDWCLGRLAEHAFDSGALLGKAMVDSFS